MSIVTWNIWFSPHARDRRAAMLCDALRDADADVVCLQEVTTEVLPALRDLASVGGYCLSDIAWDGDEGYGTVMLARLPVRAFQRHALPTSMGRDLCVALVEPPGAPPLAVATAHLESRRWNNDVRAEQLDVALPLLRQLAPAAALCGDFNFDDGWPEESRLHAAPDFCDVWRAHGRGGPGYTVDTRRNGMTAAHKGTEKQTRYDRALVRGASPRGITLLGTEAHPDDPSLFVSDHFGLRVELALP